MKKRLTRLELHRETVRHLDPLRPGDLAPIHGGATRVVAILSPDNAYDCGTVMSGPDSYN
jgi:hypothetical protein